MLRTMAVVGGALLALVGSTGMALAQDASTLTGDWRGARGWLRDLGVEIALSQLTDASLVVDGGWTAGVDEWGNGGYIEGR